MFSSIQNISFNAHKSEEPTRFAMKIKSTLLVFFLLQFSLNRIGAQFIQSDSPGLPLKPDKSILFANDIFINDDPIQNQRNVALCSAFNGWLYAAYYYDNAGIASVRIMRSTDNGVNWTMLVDPNLAIYNCIFTKLDIIATGNDVSDIKVFLGSVWLDTLLNVSGAYVTRFNGVTGGAYEDEILHEHAPHIYDLALAYDFMYPATNSNPFSIAVLYTKYYYNTDSLIFCSSSNGGISFDNHRVVQISSVKFHKVALAYGVSQSWSSGKYFAAWEEQENATSNLGHIYTAHTSPDFNSPFTIPVCLDSLDPNSINKVRNPVIACQVNDVDNDSSNLTEVVLFDKYDPSNHKYDVSGYYNLQATNHTNFKKLNISNSAHYTCQPSINFNPFDSTFMVTYYDSTTQKLPFLLNNFNLKNPDSWQFVTAGYNDNNNLAVPYPKVALNLDQKQGINVWSGERTGGNGAAMFDSPYTYYTGSSENLTNVQLLLYGSYPNPCSTEVTIWFEIQNPEKVTTTLYDISNHILKINTSQTCQAGRGVVKFDISTLSPGCYFYSLSSDKFSGSGKVIVIE